MWIIINTSTEIIFNLPIHSSSAPALKPGGQMSFLGATVEDTGASVTAPGTASSKGLPAFPAHLYPPIVFSQRYFGHGGRGSWHSLMSERVYSIYQIFTGLSLSAQMSG